jgi:hypothetical protein
MPFSLPSYRKRSLLNIFGRLCQLIGAIAVCVYYGRVLHEAMRRDVYGDARWVRLLFPVPVRFCFYIRQDCALYLRKTHADGA